MTRKATGDGGRRRVLVIHDYGGACALLTRALDAEGYVVQAACNGRAT